MPTAPLSRCTTTGCHARATPDGRGHCATHRPVWVKQASSAWTGGSTRAWRKARAEWLSEHPLCADQGCGRLATEVHHVKGRSTDALMWDTRWWMSQCHQHHLQKGQPPRGGQDRYAE